MPPVRVDRSLVEAIAQAIQHTNSENFGSRKGVIGLNVDRRGRQSHRRVELPSEIRSNDKKGGYHDKKSHDPPKS